MTDMVFSARALSANRAGRLSPDQLRDLQASVRYRSRGLAGHLLHGHDAFAQDVATGQVDAAEGAITKKLGHPNAPSHEIWVASREAGNQQFTSDKALFDAAPHIGMLRLFYLPQSRWAVNFELLPDAPPAADGRFGERAGQTLLDWRAARQAHDAVGEAQARAGFAAVKREAESFLPEHGMPAAERLEPDRLREAIIGDWTSPVLSISVRGDGTLTATMAGSAAQQGHWSVDSAGRLATDVMGAPLSIDASVAGDELTLVINGQGLKLRRSPARSG
jgi:hypothetical protein